MIFILQKYTIAQGKEAKKGYCQIHYSTLVEKWYVLLLIMRTVSQTMPWNYWNYSYYLKTRHKMQSVKHLTNKLVW